MFDPRQISLRHRCRNLRCRAVLRQPVADPRVAFCDAGCRRSHYSRACLVCERVLPRKGRRPREFCSERCRLKYRRFSDRYGGAATTLQGATGNALRSADKTGLKTHTKRDRPWRVVAGPTVSLDPINLAIPLDPETAARVRRANTRYEAEAAMMGPRDWPINLNGYFQRSTP
jgi:hypothetical protein